MFCRLPDVTSLPSFRSLSESSPQSSSPGQIENIGASQAGVARRGQGLAPVPFLECACRVATVISLDLWFLMAIF